MRVITEEILDQAIVAAKQGQLDDLTYKQDSWCGTACCVLGFARHIAGREGIHKGPQDGEIEDTPRAQTIRALMKNGSPEILDIMAVVRSDGSLPAGLHISGYLNLSEYDSLESLPTNLTVDSDLSLSGCTRLKSLPNGLVVGGDLNLDGCTSLKSLPAGFKVGGSIDLYGCTELESLPNGLSVSDSLVLRGCIRLKSLPANLNVGGALVLTDCPATIPTTAKIGSTIYR